MGDARYERLAVSHIADFTEEAKKVLEEKWSQLSLCSWKTVMLCLTMARLRKESGELTDERKAEVLKMLDTYGKHLSISEVSEVRRCLGMWETVPERMYDLDQVMYCDCEDAVSGR